MFKCLLFCSIHCNVISYDKIIIIIATHTKHKSYYAWHTVYCVSDIAVLVKFPTGNRGVTKSASLSSVSLWTSQCDINISLLIADMLIK